MKKEANFYKIAAKQEQSHEYDLAELGETMHKGIAMAFMDGDQIIGGNPFFALTSQKDYDEKFVELLLEIYPVYKVTDVLTYHYENYESEKGGKVLFITHIEYVILPLIIEYKNSGLSKIVENWINQNKTAMYKKLLEEKNQFLSEAYKHAYKEYPTSPFSVDMNPIVLGQKLGFDEATVTRIMHELVADGYAQSGLGMGSLSVTSNGLKYLTAIESKPQTTASVNVNVGNNSNVQFQQGNTNSSQNITVQSNDKDLYILISDIRTNLSKIEKYLSSEQVSTLVEDVNYLESSLNRTTPNKSILQTVKSNIWDILKSIPANVIANVITGQIPPL